MTQILSNGIIKTGELYDSDSMLLNTFSSEGYTPTTAVNSTMGKYIIGFKANTTYIIELLVTWNGFKTNTPSNFNIWFQGDTYDGTSWSWSRSNEMITQISKIQNLKTLVLSADSGSKFLKTNFTVGSTNQGLNLGCRSDYSNGVGTITFSNVKVYPAEYSGSRIYDKKIVMSDFIEI